METLKGTEKTASPEKIPAYTSLIGLQGRLMVGGEALNPLNKTVQVTKNNIDDGFAEVIGLTNTVSIADSRDFWKNREEKTHAEKMEAWKNQFVVAVTQKGDYFLNDQQGKTQADFFKKILNIDFLNFDATSAQVIYDQYFTKGDRVTNFVYDLFNKGKDIPKAEYNSQITNVLPTIQWFCQIFGKDSSEIITQAIDAQLQLSNNPDQFCINTKDAVNTIDTNEPRSIELLTKLYNAKKPVQTEETNKKILKPDEKPIETKPPKPESPKPKQIIFKAEPITITPEQNLRTAQVFCNNLRNQIKNGDMTKGLDSRLTFTDLKSGMSLIIPRKEAADKAWFQSHVFTNWANKYNLPLVIWHQADHNHFTLLLKGPEKGNDGKWRIAIYDPFISGITYEEVKVKNNLPFEEYCSRRLKELQPNYDPSSHRYLLDKNIHCPEEGIKRYIFSEWFLIPKGRTKIWSQRGHDSLANNTYNLDIERDPKLPEGLKTGKGQRMQSDGFNCGPLSFYSGVLRYLALPGNEQEKKIIQKTFQEQFGILIYTRDQLIK